MSTTKKYFPVLVQDEINSTISSGRTIIGRDWRPVMLLDRVRVGFRVRTPTSGQLLHNRPSNYSVGQEQVQLRGRTSGRTHGREQYERQLEYCRKSE